jgi:uncharacterized membrane protein
VDPAREDTVVRGLSEAVGGPTGEHAAPSRSRASIIVILLAVLTFGVHWIQKSPCMDGAWVDHKQYTHFCYTDILALYYAEGLNQGQVPYIDHAVEYPVLTGYWMGMLGLPIHDLGQDRPGLNQGETFYNLNALLLSGLGIAAIAVVLALRRRRPWDAAMFALAPALVVTATVNWDLLAVGLTAFFMYAWARRWPAAAGLLLGLATAAKFYPLFLVGPLIVLAIRSGRWKAAAITVGTGVVTWAAVNAPVFFGGPEARTGWFQFWTLSDTRGIDWGTFWYIGVHTPTSPNPNGGLQPFLWLGDHIPILNRVTYGLFALGCLGVLYLGLRAPRRPRMAQLCFIVVALFLLTSKVWSQQFVLWLIPLAVMARPRWGAFLAWQAAEILYFLAFYAQLLNADGVYTIPEGTFVLAATLRWVTVAVLVGLVVRDILRPSQDVVRRTYGDDPDGGDFDGAPDNGLVWIDEQLERFREWRRSRAAAASA